MSKPQLIVETLWPETLGHGPSAIPREKENDSPLIAEDGACCSIIDSKKKVDELFFKWLCEPDVKEQVHELVRQARDGTLALSPSRKKALTSPRGSHRVMCPQNSMWRGCIEFFAARTYHDH